MRRLKFKYMKNKAIYYDIRDDINKYPDAWAYLVWSKRGPGKTYSTLRMMVEDNEKFVFMKRTIEDVNLMCARMEESEDPDDNDLSPFAPLNRDFGWNVYPFIISAKGLAAFYHGEVGEDGKLHPVGQLLGWIVACSAVTKFKGFSMHDANYMIFDEFIPKPWERINKKEGDSVLDMYETISRDRLKRGKKPLKLICLANATSLNNPMFNILEVVDIAAEMDIKDLEYYYLDVGIMLHCINSQFDITDDTVKSGIQKHMEGTAWGMQAYGGHFGYNDFSCIGMTSLKYYKPVCVISYKRDTYYLYRKEGRYYMCRTRSQTDKIYNLNRETEQKLFFMDVVLELREACIEDKVLFETYTMYDIIMNYKKYFNI